MAKMKSFRRILAQILASTPKNVSYLNGGFIFALPTVIIPAISGLNPTNNPNETLLITFEQASWIASLIPMFSIIGCVSSNCMEPLGRKISIILSFIPFLMGWTSLYYESTSIEMIYIVMCILGFGLGFASSPCITYVSEVCEPTLRAILSAVGMLAAAFGMAVVYVLGNLMPWRDATLIYAATSLSALLFTFLVPETPQWLLSKDRSADAMKSLQWLRGWVQPNDVRNEFEYLQHHKIVTYVCIQCEKQATNCNHPNPKLIDRLRDLLRRKTLIPFVIVSSQFFISAFLGSAFRPYFVQILYDFDSSIDPNRAVPWLGYIGFVGNALLIFVVRPLGKRYIYLVSLATAILIYFGLGVYAYESVAIDRTKFGAHYSGVFQYFPMVGLVTIHFLNNFGFNGIPSLIVGEVFSFRSRGLALGLAMAFEFASIYLSTKTFYLIKAVATPPGQWIFYGLLGAVQLVMTYLTMPETENRTLEEIEMFFSNKKRRFNDIYIPKISHLNSPPAKY